MLYFYCCEISFPNGGGRFTMDGTVNTEERIETLEEFLKTRKEIEKHFRSILQVDWQFGRFTFLAFNPL